MRIRCADCKKFTDHVIKGNLKFCGKCNVKTSYKHDLSKFRKRIREVDFGKSYSGEDSAYWNWVSKHSIAGSIGDVPELAEANPDWLSDEDAMYKPCSESDKDQFDTIIAHIDKLSLREKEVIQLLWEGKKMREVAVILSLSLTAVKTLLARARKKLQACSLKQA